MTATNYGERSTRGIGAAAADRGGLSDEVDAQTTEEADPSWLSISVTVLGFLIVFFDGYDGTVLSFAAHALASTWRLHGPGSLAPAFMSSMLGMLLGAPLFGFVADRIGRKPPLIGACVVFGVFTLMTAACGSLGELVVLRFLSGLGLGGASPIALALTSEFAPQRYRATLVTLMFSGITLGSGAPGVFAMLGADHDWKLPFIVGGAVPLVLAVVAFLAMPESVSFLARTGREAVAHWPAARGGWKDAAGAEAGVGVDASPSFRSLFQDKYGRITALVWSSFFFFFMSFYFLSTWTPALLRAFGVTGRLAALAQVLFQVGGFVGGVVTARLFDKGRRVPLPALFLIAGALVAAIGWTGTRSPVLLIALETVTGFFVLGLGFQIMALSGLFYPTRIRGTGAGWGFGVGRFGSIAGIFAGGQFLSAHLPFGTLFALAAAPLLVGSVVAGALARFAPIGSYAEPSARRR